MKKLNIRIAVVYRNNVFLMSTLQKEILEALDSLIFILKKTRFGDKQENISISASARNIAIEFGCHFHINDFSFFRG